MSAVGTLRILDGQRLMLIKKNNIVTDVACDWMPAAQRIALGIPLHPDRMQPTDWKVLPGIGEKLAWKIENDRQINGDFGSLNALTRVPGIGISVITSYSIHYTKLYMGQPPTGWRNGPGPPGCSRLSCCGKFPLPAGIYPSSGRNA